MQPAPCPIGRRAARHDAAGARAPRACARRWLARRLLPALLLALVPALPASGDDDVAPRFAPARASVELAHTALSPLERRFVARHPELRVAIHRTDYLPYWRIGADGEIEGQAIELLQTLAAAAGFRLVPRVYDTWPEVLQALRERRADVIPIAAYTAERDSYLDYGPGAFPDPAGLIGRAGDTRFDDEDDFAGVRIAVGHGFVEEMQLGILYPLAVPVPSEGVPGALDKLASGEADLVLSSIVPAVAVARDRGDLSLRIVRRIHHGTGWNHVVSRSDRPLIGRILGRLVGEGRPALVETLSDTLGAPAASELAPLSLTGREVATLERYETLRLGAVVDLPMLNGVTTNGTHTGIASGFSAHVAYQLGLPVEIVRYDGLEDMLTGAEAGEIDLLPLVPTDPALEGRLAFSAPYLETPWIAVGRQEEPHGSKLERFAGARMGLRTNHPLKAHVEREHPDITIVEYDRPRELLRGLVRGDVDVTLAASLAVLPLIDRSFAGEVHSLGELDLPPARFAFAAPEASAELIPLVDRALERMDPAVAERLVRRWAAVDFTPSAALRRWLSILVPAVIGLGALVLVVIWRIRRIAADNRRRLIAEQRLIDMTEGLRSGVFQVRQEAGTVRLVFANSETARLLRLPPGHDGTPARERFVDHVHDADRCRVAERIRASLRTGAAFRETFRFSFPDGQDGWMLAEAAAREEPGGARVWNGHLFDLTSERRFSEELAALLAAKEEFVAAAGHELRAPVQNISLALEALESSSLDAVQRRRLRTAAHGVRDLRELVDDLLDVARLDARGLVLRKATVRLPELFESVACALEGAIREKGLAFECRVDPTLPPLVRLDPARLRQILYNLVGNATKYTDRGTVTLEALAGDPAATDFRAAAPSAGTLEAHHLLVEVRDSGIGIPAPELAAIFEPFSNVGPMPRRGAGLGLTICRRLVTLMEGRIRVESEPGRGSTFRVCLPLEPVGEGVVDGPGRALAERSASVRREHPGVPASVATASGREPVPLGSSATAGADRVLLVDDDPGVRETLAALLRQQDIDTDEAESAGEALERLERRAYTAVVTDLRMPDTNGIELARIVRRRGGGQTLVAMTGGVSGADVEHASELFDAVLIKPVTAAQVSRALARAERGSAAAADVAEG